MATFSALFGHKQVDPEPGVKLPKGVTLHVDQAGRDVIAKAGGTKIAHLSLEPSGEARKRNEAGFMRTAPEYEGKGIMTALHKTAEKHFGPMHPSGTLSAGGKAFWKSYRPGSVAEQRIPYTHVVIGHIHYPATATKAAWKSPITHYVTAADGEEAKKIALGNYTKKAQKTITFSDVKQLKEDRTFADLFEAKVIKADVGHAVVPVHHNPTGEQLHGLMMKSKDKHVRGYADHTGAYFWDAHKAIHHEIAHAIGLNYDYQHRINVHHKEGLAYVDPDINAGPESNSHVKKLVNHPKVGVYVGGKGVIPGDEYTKDMHQQDDALFRELHK